MAAETAIEIESITFTGHEKPDARRAKVQIGVRTAGGVAFSIPMAFIVHVDDQGAVVEKARAAFHRLTSSLADQTKGWAGAG